MADRPDPRKAPHAAPAGTPISEVSAEPPSEGRARTGGRSTVRTDVGTRKRVTKQTPTRGLGTAQTVDFGRIVQDGIDPRALVVPKQADSGPATEDYGAVLDRLPTEHADALRALMPAARPDALPIAIDARHETSSTEDFGPAVALRGAPAERVVAPPVEHETPQEWNAGPRTEDLGPPVEALPPAPAHDARPPIALPRPTSAPIAPPPSYTTPPAPAPLTPAPLTPEPAPEPLDDDRPSWLGMALVAIAVGVVIWLLVGR